MHLKNIFVIILIFFIASSCKKDETQDPGSEIPTGELELINSYPIDVPEPSGLSFGSDKNTLLTVSDNTNQIYELDLQGNVIRIIDFTGRDLEGVTYNPDENHIAVIDERDREVALIDYDSGNTLEIYQIDVPIGSENSGLEGISYNSNNKHYYIVNEANPGMMLVWSPSSGVISQDNLQFASDYSGIFADANLSHLWFLSDASQRLYKCNYGAEVLLAFNLDKQKYEGVVIDNDLCYLVNDATARLNIYKIKIN